MAQTPSPLPTLAAAPSTGSIVALFAMLVLLILAAYFTTKFVGGKANRFFHSKYMLLLDRLNISKDKSVMIVKVGEKHYVLGVSAQRVSLIDTLPEDSLTELEAPKTTLPSWMQRFFVSKQTDESASPSARPDEKDVLDEMEQRIARRMDRPKQFREEERDR